VGEEELRAGRDGSEDDEASEADEDEGGQIMNVRDVIALYRVPNVQLCRIFKIVYTLEGNKRVHDKLHHGRNFTKDLHVKPGQVYCLECDVKHGSTNAFREDLKRHGFKVSKGKRGTGSARRTKGCLSSTGAVGDGGPPMGKTRRVFMAHWYVLLEVFCFFTPPPTHYSPPPSSFLSVEPPLLASKPTMLASAEAAIILAEDLIFFFITQPVQPDPVEEQSITEDLSAVLDNADMLRLTYMASPSLWRKYGAKAEAAIPAQH
jgi:hypothetical protein